jgi:hypothetical protein
MRNVLSRYRTGHWDLIVRTGWDKAIGLEFELEIQIFPQSLHAAPSRPLPLPNSLEFITRDTSCSPTLHRLDEFNITRNWMQNPKIMKNVDYSPPPPQRKQYCGLIFLTAFPLKIKQSVECLLNYSLALLREEQQTYCISFSSSVFSLNTIV